MVEHVACSVRKRDAMSAGMRKNVAAGMLPGENAQRGRRQHRCSAGMRGTQERKERRKDRNAGMTDIQDRSKRNFCGEKARWSIRGGTKDNMA